MYPANTGISNKIFNNNTSNNVQRYFILFVQFSIRSFISSVDIGVEGIVN